MKCDCSRIFIRRAEINRNKYAEVLIATYLLGHLIAQATQALITVNPACSSGAISVASVERSIIMLCARLRSPIAYCEAAFSLAAEANTTVSAARAARARLI
ncbi:hypothetical protein D3C81_1969320 [compost metagenome]